MNAEKIQDEITEKIYQYIDKYGQEPKRIILKNKVVEVLSKDLDEKSRSISRFMYNLKFHNLPAGTTPQVNFFKGIPIKVAE